MTRIKMFFEGKKIKPGDVVVVRPEKLTSAWDAKEAFETVKKAFPDNHVVFLLPDYYLETYNKEEFKKFLDKQYKYLEEDKT